MTVRAPDQMTCRELVRVVTEYFEGTISLEDRTRLEHHLVFCDWCVDYLQQMRDTLRIAGELREEDVPPKLEAELLRAFRDWKRGPP
jgi:predicted anti-sigma-YlaC factor YlaD